MYKFLMLLLIFAGFSGTTGTTLASDDVSSDMSCAQIGAKFAEETSVIFAEMQRGYEAIIKSQDELIVLQDEKIASLKRANLLLRELGQKTSDPQLPTDESGVELPDPDQGILDK